jgi:S-adenosylmethionine uptake transporter
MALARAWRGWLAASQSCRITANLGVPLLFRQREPEDMHLTAANKTRRSTMHGVALSFLGYAVYALSDASVRLLRGAIPAFELVFLGSVLGLFAVPFVRGPNDHWRDLLSCRDRRMWMLRAVAAVAGAVCSVVAFTQLPMAEAFALLFLLPAFVTILSVIFLKEPVGWRRWSAVVAGFIGVLVVLRPGFHDLKIGHIAALGGGFAGAVTIVLLRYLGTSEKRTSLYGAGLMGPLVAGLMLSLPNFVLPTAHDVVFIFSYGLLAAAGNVLMMVSSRMAPASIVAPTQYSQMLWGIGLGYCVFGDRLDGIMVLGALIIVSAGLFTFMREEVKLPRFADRHPPVHPQ